MSATKSKAKKKRPTKREREAEKKRAAARVKAQKEQIVESIRAGAPAILAADELGLRPPDLEALLDADPDFETRCREAEDFAIARVDGVAYKDAVGSDSGASARFWLQRREAERAERDQVDRPGEAWHSGRGEAYNQ